MIAATVLAVSFGTNLGTWHKHADHVETVTNAYAVVTVANQSIAFGTMRRNNAWLGWRGETSPMAVFGVPVRGAVTVGATAERTATYAVLERDWDYYRKTMLSADGQSRPHGRSASAVVVGRKTVVDPLVLLSVGAEVWPGWTVWFSKSDALHLTLEWKLK